jgi:hypothetical protein
MEIKILTADFKFFISKSMSFFELKREKLRTCTNLNTMEIKILTADFKFFISKSMSFFELKREKLRTCTNRFKYSSLEVFLILNQEKSTEILYGFRAFLTKFKIKIFQA